MARFPPDTGLKNLREFKIDMLDGIHLLHLLLMRHSNVAYKDISSHKAIFSQVQKGLLLVPISHYIEEYEGL